MRVRKLESKSCVRCSGNWALVKWLCSKRIFD